MAERESVEEAEILGFYADGAVDTPFVLPKILGCA
jgi:hypothetical protein